MRDDVSFSIDDSQREMLLDEAPDRVDDFIAVKKIIEQ
jgi:Asp-tRNA(Asn)/Glu-tRNA(Gln) amidotransferase C subunit